MMENLHPAPYRRRAINQARAQAKEPQTKALPLKVGASGSCPKCGKIFPRGLNFHYTRCSKP